MNNTVEKLIWHDLNTKEAALNTFILYLKMFLLNSTQTLVSIAALTSLISYQFRLIGLLINRLVNSSPTSSRDRPTNINNNNNNRHQNGDQQPPPVANEANDFASVGDVSAILFFLLCVQSGMSSLKGEQRVEKFLKNYSLLFIAILHYFHTSLDAQLMTLVASSKPEWNSERHLRLLGVCVVMIVLPVCILATMFGNFSMSTWLLAASAFNVELVVKMTVSLSIYALFIYDSIRIANAQRKLFGEGKKSDDGDAKASSSNLNELVDNTEEYIYWIRAIGHIVEFFVALVLFFNGAYILLFESYGAIRTLMMTIHAYFHIWCQARKGWSVYMKRRSAISKMKLLPVFNLQSFAELMRKKSHMQTQNHGITEQSNEEILRNTLDNIENSFDEMKSES